VPVAKSLSVRDMDDIDFQRREWRFQRAGWGLLTLLIVAALAGTFGAGPVSETTAESPDGSVTVEYERFIRHIGTTTLTIAPGASAVVNGKVQVHISRELVTGWRIENVSPAPSTESSSDDWLIWEFDALGDTPPEIKLLYRGDGFGRHDGSIRAGTGTGLDVWQWIYP
jgi:hypothetical protein